MRKTHRPLTTAALALSLFMAALEMTVVSTAMPTVVSDLGGIEHYAWVFTAYMLASTVTVPIFGKLTDLYGRKPIILFGITLFLAGSVASGLSPSMQWLIVFRTVQGLGAGAIQPTTLTIIGDLYSLEERGRVQGLFSAVWAVSGLVGPLAGGLIVRWLSWHWIFYINVPVGLGTMVLLFIFFHEHIEKQKRPLDIVGAVLLSLGVVALLLGAQGHDNRLVPLVVAAVLLGAFVLVERKVKEPIMPPSVLVRPTIAIASVTSALFSAAMFGASTYVPLFVQGVLGGTATQAGAMLTPMLVAWPVCALICGRVMVKVGFRPLIMGGLGLSALSTVVLALVLRPGAPLLLPELAMGLFGAGLGFAATALLIAVQTSVGWEMRGVATASNMFFRTIGGALGVGAMGGVLVERLTADPRIPVSAANELLGPEHGRGLGEEVLRQLSGSLADGLATNFWIMAAMSVLAFAFSFFFPRVKTGAKAEAGEAAMH
ncbi:MDR family MFS transporter [Hyalangium gracile]|uniref:MDR family MFS transporter n=1 Tax=Hyalangium gracile TaxID=394092 RepID=UPI001CCD2EE0|nr:MDR family MFS transporter [Hyalangium gracile]